MAVALESNQRWFNQLDRPPLGGVIGARYISVWWTILWYSSLIYLGMGEEEEEVEEVMAHDCNASETLGGKSREFAIGNSIVSGTSSPPHPHSDLVMDFIRWIGCYLCVLISPFQGSRINLQCQLLLAGLNLWLQNDFKNIFMFQNLSNFWFFRSNFCNYYYQGSI